VQLDDSLRLVTGVTVAHQYLQVGPSLGKRLKRLGKDSCLTVNLLTPKHDSLYRHKHLDPPSTDWKRGNSSFGCWPVTSSKTLPEIKHSVAGELSGSPLFPKHGELTSQEF
jgi:hypothetical protein